jgi:hypothetical protein
VDDSESCHKILIGILVWWQQLLFLFSLQHSQGSFLQEVTAYLLILAPTLIIVYVLVFGSWVRYSLPMLLISDPSCFGKRNFLAQHYSLISNILDSISLSSSISWDYLPINGCVSSFLNVLEGVSSL